MVKGKVRPTCCLSYSEGAETKPKSASYTCECGTTFKGLKAWRELHNEVRDLHTFGSGPDRPLPPFPGKASFSRQTPAFLAARAKAIER